MSPFPTGPDDDSSLRVLEVGTDGADDALQALSSRTARTVVSALEDGPKTASDVADAEAVDTSLQNVHYHLNRLEDAGVVDVVDTADADRGRRMDVYATTGSPLVIVAGDEAARETVIDRLSELVGGIGLLAGLAVAVQRLLHTGASATPRASAGSPPELLPPGLLVFLVGTACLLAWIGVATYRNGVVAAPVAEGRA
ncbi:MAG: ArsR/SmtB family transcription factor [Haloplanus sp.]